VSALLHQWAALAATLPQRVLGLVGWLAAMALLFGVFERLRPARSQRFLRRDLGVDLAYYFLSGIVPAFAVAAATVAVSWVVSGWVPTRFMTTVAELPLGLRVALLIVVGDAAYYGIHRASHVVPWLWRFHRIHHSPTELDWLVNTRAHPVDLMVARVVPLVPLLVFGLRQPGLRDMEAVAALYLTLTTVWAFFVHANVRVRLGPLEHVITSPAFHHWHHHQEAGVPQHCNFASLLPVLDRLFGTWHLPRDRLPKVYGAADPLPPTLAGQLLSPFRAMPPR
jgi:sterol desaturase/sphingolipid hydroxylase (fatty acid hydroxylase superfamily)